MIIADRLHLLAIQAAKRIEVLGMDPVESIRRALIYATSPEQVLARQAAMMTKREAETVLALGSSAMPLRDAALAIGVKVDVAYHRLVRLKARGVVRQPRRGLWEVVP